MRNRRGPEPPAEVKAMSALGPLMKLAAVFVGKQPEEQLEPRGSLGIAFGPGDGDPGIPVAAVLEGSPAARVGIQPGDRLLSLGDHPLHEAVDAHVAAADLAPGETVELMLRRGADTLNLTLTLGDGF
jgi:S1-C subfamily serine protease